MRSVVRLASGNIVRVAVDEQSMPSEVNRQVGAVAVDAVAGPNVDEYPGVRSDDGEQKNQDAVLAMATSSSQGGTRCVLKTPYLMQQQSLRQAY